MIADQHIRDRALDPQTSFCVTAPAGSGKTELLTQRILNLLVRVDRPEQVLAITFTRKAAAEMRERLVGALADARASRPVGSEHAQRTRDLALAVVAHADVQGWSLDDPEIFNIRTIDSLCHYLTRQMPLLSGLGGKVLPTDDAGPLYEAAVDALFEQGFSDPVTAEALTSLLLSFSNNWSRLRTLLVTLLGRRGDWVHRSLGQGGVSDPEAQMQQTMVDLLTGHLQRLRDAMGSVMTSQLRDMAVAAGESITVLADLDELGRGALAPAPPDLDLSANAAQLHHWQWVAELLLKKDGQFRKQLTKNQGFPPADKARKAAASELIAAMSENSQLHALWYELKALPSISVDDAAWTRVMQLVHLLPRLEAHLLLVFRERGEVDHIHVSLAAESALGSDEQPTDLALRLDYQLEHILIDEFQDTSDSQFRLLERLTRDWATHNATGSAPRTVFVVGDGMQSIYRFRNANVGLFIEARDRGINGLQLEPLALTSNFRSQGALVEWVNHTFSQLLPDDDDPSRGQIRHSAASAVHEPLPGDAVAMHLFEQGQGGAEAQWIVNQLSELRSVEPEASIAILGRSRRHLAPLMSALKIADLSFIGRDLEPLSRSPVVMDLMSLCRWLSNPADSIAAVALLRSPACGLRLEDIARLLEGSPRPISLLVLLGDPPASLTDDGMARVRALAEVLSWAESTRDRLGLSVWVEQIWLRLQGPTLTPTAQWQEAAQFFDLLEQAEAAGVGLDVEGLERLLANRYAEHDASDNPIELLTMHKSKGLQFDYVFIPGLTAGVGGNDRDLLRWHWHQGVGGRGLLIAADDGSEAGDNSLYQYLGWIDKQKGEAEIRRLLYVAVTRARKRVWLTGEADNAEDWGSRGKGRSLMALLAEGSGQAPVVHEPIEELEYEHDNGNLLRRTGFSTVEVSPPLTSAGTAVPMLPASTGNLIDRAYGTALHRALELVSAIRPLPTGFTDPIKRAVVQVLRTQVENPTQLRQLSAQVLTDIDRCLRCEQGRWVLGADREARSELALVDAADGGREQIIDRTFVDDQNTRWIVDYKSSKPQDEDIEGFLAEESARYREQLSGYARLMHRLDGSRGASRTVRCALYFTALARFHEVPVSVT